MQFFEERKEEKTTLWAKGLREHREKKRISLRKLASQIGISYTHLHNIELNKIKANLDTAKKIEKVLLSA